MIKIILMLSLSLPMFAGEPTMFAVQQDLYPIVTPPHPWTKYTFYFQDGQLVESLRGMNRAMGCTIEADALVAGDNLVVYKFEARDVVSEECAEWGSSPGGDDYCVRFSGQYYPRYSLDLKVSNPRVRKIHCSKKSSELRSLSDRMTDADRLSQDDWRTIFGGLVRPIF